MPRCRRAKCCTAAGKVEGAGALAATWRLYAEMQQAETRCIQGFELSQLLRSSCSQLAVIGAQQSEECAAGGNG